MPLPDLKKSAALLTGTNLVCAAIGVSQGLLVIRLLGPETYGAAAVVVALAAVAANLVDVRLIDLMSNLYYDERASCPDTGAAYRASALRLVLRFYVASAVLIALASAGLMFVGVRRLTGAEFLPSWLWAAAAAQGVSYLGSFFIFIQRFTAPPRRMAILQLVSALINAIAMIAFVAASRTIGGYVFGLLASATGIAFLNAVYMVTILRRDGVELFGLHHPAAPAVDRRVIFRFVAAGNLLGYVKLLHRSADVLLVAVFCGDRETGIYKLARSITDAFLAVSEAVGRVYQPRLLALLQERDRTEYGAVARSLTAMAAALTVAALGGVLALMPYLAPVLGVADAQGLTLSVVIMTLTFFFIAGMQSWIWPAFVFSGRLGRCTLWGAIAVVGAIHDRPGPRVPHRLRECGVVQPRLSELLRFFDFAPLARAAARTADLHLAGAGGRHAVSAQQHPLHVVQISRDTGLLRPSADSEPVQRQLDYARELNRRVPGGSVTIIVLSTDSHEDRWERENLRVIPLCVGGSLRGGLDCLRALQSLHETAPISVITTQTAIRRRLAGPRRRPLVRHSRHRPDSLRPVHRAPRCAGPGSPKLCEGGGRGRRAGAASLGRRSEHCRRSPPCGRCRPSRAVPSPGSRPPFRLRPSRCRFRWFPRTRAWAHCRTNSRS